MTSRERMLRTIHRTHPDHIPGWFWWDGEWPKYHSKEEIDSLAGALDPGLISHGIPLPSAEPFPDLGPNFTRDHWGCVWQSEVLGISGQVVRNPIASYHDLPTYQPPLHVLDIESEVLDGINHEIAASAGFTRPARWLNSTVADTFVT